MYIGVSYSVLILGRAGIEVYVLCILQNSTTATTTTNTDLMENWNTLRHQSHPSVLSSWTPNITDFAPYMQ